MQGKAVNPQPDISRGVSVVQALGFGLLAFFLFVTFSRVFDVYLTGYHIPGVIGRIMAAVVILSGAFLRPFRSSIGKNLLWLTVWMMVGLPFSVWRGDSLSVFIGGWWPCLVVFVAVAGLIKTFQQYRAIAWTTAFSIFVLGIFCLHYGTVDNGRLWMTNEGRFANPNEMAQALLIGIPLWLAISKRSAYLVGKLAASGVIVTLMYIIAQTGSRGALFSCAALFLAMFFRASFSGKAKLLLIGGICLGAALALLSGPLQNRYKTLFDSDLPQTGSKDRVVDSALSSTASREHLLQQSLILIASHPFVGVGLGQFMVAENELAVSQGERKGSWLGTHNSYTQVASETGVPGIIFFLAVLFISLKTTHALYAAAKSEIELRDVAAQAEALFFSLVCLATTDLFIHVAYTMLLPVLAGMAISLKYTSEPLVADVKRRKAEAVLPVAAAP